MSQCENEEGSGNRFGGLQIVTEPVEGDSAPKHTPSRPSMFAVCPDFIISTFTLCDCAVCIRNLL